MSPREKPGIMRGTTWGRSAADAPLNMRRHPRPRLSTSRDGRLRFTVVARVLRLPNEIGWLISTFRRRSPARRRTFHNKLTRRQRPLDVNARHATASPGAEDAAGVPVKMASPGPGFDLARRTVQNLQAHGGSSGLAALTTLVDAELESASSPARRDRAPAASKDFAASTADQGLRLVLEVAPREVDPRAAEHRGPSPSATTISSSCSSRASSAWDRPAVRHGRTRVSGRRTAARRVEPHCLDLGARCGRRSFLAPLRSRRSPTQASVDGWRASAGRHFLVISVEMAYGKPAALSTTSPRCAALHLHERALLPDGNKYCAVISEMPLACGHSDCGGGGARLRPYGSPSASMPHVCVIEWG